MKTNIEEIETTEAAATTTIATDVAEASTTEKKVSKAWEFAINHVGFVEILDPELRAQLSYYRKKDKKMAI